MAKRRSSSSGEEVSLFPFLSILACLIGAIILIIVVLAVSQSQQTDGRSPVEMEQAREFQELLAKQEEQKKVNAELEEKIKKLKQLKQDLGEKDARLVKLRKLLSSSAEIQQMNQEISQELLKELDNLLLEVEGLTKQEKVIKEEIAALLKEIELRQPPKDKVTPPVVVQPGGSGLAQGTKVYFVEASGGRLTLYWDASQKTVLSAAAEVVASDVAWNHFLTEVKSVPNAKIIFLLRDDGMGAFNNGAGWAQGTYGFGVDQIGRLAIPGRGEIDLKMFNEFLGTLPPHPDAKIVTPPAAPAAAATPAAPATS